MTRFSLGLIAFSLAMLAPQTGSSQDTAAPPLHVLGVGNQNVTLAADSIVRKDPQNAARATPYASEVELKGHVEIRMCCVQRPVSRQNPKPVRAYMVVRADEADYHGETGEFEARGTVKVRFSNASSSDRR